MGISFSVFGSVEETGTGFNLDVGASGNNIFRFTEEQKAGGYSITSQLADGTMDIYALASDNTLSGYTSTKALTATKPFDTIVLYGALNNDLISFEFKPTTVPTEIGTISSGGVGPRVISTNISSLPDQNDVITINGENFADNVSVTFTGQDGVVLTAKSVTKISTTQIQAVRPDSFNPANNPYTLSVFNGSSPSPVGSSAHILSNSVTAGSAPAWQSQALINTPASVGIPYSITLAATDTEGSTMSYSIVSGSLPEGLSFNTNTGVISGTPTTTDVDGNEYLFTVRATDTGGNFVDRQFTINSNAKPEWVTTSPLPNGPVGSAYSSTFSVATGIFGSEVSYSVTSGTLPQGLSLNSNTGVISGTPSANASTTFTVRAQDQYGLYSDKEFILITNTPPSWATASGQITEDAQLNASANGIATSVTYSVQSGALATGLSLNSSTGLISGAMQAQGTFNFTIRATDNLGFFTDRAFSQVIEVTPVTTTYNYSGLIETFNTSSTSGNIEIVLNGASGARGGAGGRVTATIPAANVPANLYIVVGGNGSQGRNASGGFNGGGQAGGNRGNEGSGGGATHIASASGQLSSLVNNQSAVIAVAGSGGGGGGYSGGSGGAGGGVEGVAGNSGQGGGGGGGTQTAGGGAGFNNGGSASTAGSFGQGGVGGVSWNAGGGGGGGGWYGGGAGGADDNDCCADGGGGGGGSGYTAPYLTNVTNTAGASTGTSASITYYTFASTI